MIKNNSNFAKKIKRKLISSYRNGYPQTRRSKLRQIAHSYDPKLETIVIYQMGKVGSSTIKHSLQELDYPMNVYHLHALTQERIDWQEKIFKHASKIKGKTVLHDHVVEGIFLRKLLDQNKQKRWKIVTLVRDPIARNISTFFQSLDVFFPEWVKEHESEQHKLVDYVDQMIDLFLNEADHELPLVWFDKYLKPVFDIDVYAQEYSSERGYSIYKNDHVDMLLMRLEDVNQSASSAFKEFLGIESFALKKANISSEKSYSEAYKKFNEVIKLPDSYIEEMSASKFLRHFYSAKEIEKIIMKWSR